MGQLSTTMQSYSVCCYNCSEFLFAPLHRRNLIFKKKKKKKNQPTQNSPTTKQLFSRALGSLCSLVEYKCIIRDHTWPHFPPVLSNCCRVSFLSAQLPHMQKNRAERYLSPINHKLIPARTQGNRVMLSTTLSGLISFSQRLS